MGAYGSQLNPAQRWWVVKYIRSKQGAAGAAKPSGVDSAAVASPTNTTPKKDSAATGMVK
jgi:mono/diheme cytochrome c family protein